MAKKKNENEEGLPKKAKRTQDSGKLEEISEDDNEEVVLEIAADLKSSNKKEHKSSKKRKESSHSEQDDANEQAQNASEKAMEKKDKAQKSKKKKRDRWGQIVDDVGNTQGAAHEDMDGGRQTLKERDDFQSHEDEYDSKTVCVGGMPYDTTKEDIVEFFAECGTIAHVLCMRFADTQRFKGLAFITFKRKAAASKALALDGAHMGERCIKVDLAKEREKVFRDPPEREAGSLSVYIGNLDWGVQKVHIMRFFKGCDIDNVRLAVDKATGEFRGYGHVDFSNDVSLEKAIKMDQRQLFGRPVKVSYAVPKGFKSKLGLNK